MRVGIVVGAEPSIGSFWDRSLFLGCVVAVTVICKKRMRKI